MYVEKRSEFQGTVIKPDLLVVAQKSIGENEGPRGKPMTRLFSSHYGTMKIWFRYY